MTRVRIAVDRRFSDPAGQRKLRGKAVRIRTVFVLVATWATSGTAARADLLRYLPDNPVIDNAILVGYGLTQTVDGKVVPDPVYFDRTVKDNDGPSTRRALASRTWPCPSQGSWRLFASRG